jgi:RNA polymerase sigma-70 factor, ECF subfamily
MPEAERADAGMRTLAILAARALADLGLWPASQPCVAVGPTGPLVHLAEVTTGSHRSGRGRPKHRPQPGAPSSGAGSEADALGVGEAGRNITAQLSGEHDATWRLVGLAQQGDGEAFGKLYDQYVDTVYRYIYFRINDRALAEDFTSETFLRALRNIGKISYQGRDIGAWLVTIARNIVFDHQKSARHRLEVTTADPGEGSARAPSPETTVLAMLTSERLMAAVRQLGDEQRECVLLRFMQGFSVVETAEVMGKTDGAIKALQYRAVRKLAELLGQQDL